MEDAGGWALVVVQVTPPTDMTDCPHWRVAINNGEACGSDGGVE